MSQLSGGGRTGGESCCSSENGKLHSLKVKSIPQQGRTQIKTDEIPQVVVGGSSDVDYCLVG